MKILQLATLLLSANAAQSDPFVNERDMKLSQTVVTAFQMAPPKMMNQPTKDLPKEQGTHLMENAAFKEGWYYNTTRVEDKQHYLYMWKHACAYTKWVPSNQFLYAHQKYEAESMTLERFGLIGTNKKCYWGCIGVLWKRPLPVAEILGNTAPKPAPKPKPEPEPENPAPPNTVIDEEGSEILLEDVQHLAVGFPGQKVDGELVLQIMPKGDPGSVFQMHKITDGEHKGLYFLSLDGDKTRVIDVLGHEHKDKAWLYAENVDYKNTQLWHVEFMSQEGSGEITISDKDSVMCITRFAESHDENEVKEGEVEVQLEDDNFLQTAPTYSKNIKLRPCNYESTQFWYLVNKSK